MDSCGKSRTSKQPTSDNRLAYNCSFTVLFWILYLFQLPMLGWLRWKYVKQHTFFILYERFRTQGYRDNPEIMGTRTAVFLQLYAFPMELQLMFSHYAYFKSWIKGSSKEWASEVKAKGGGTRLSKIANRLTIDRAIALIHPLD